jgi:hypothetical protein
MISSNTPLFLDYINSLQAGTIVNLECPQCHNSFSRVKNVIQSKLGPHNNEKTIYCSYKCATLAKITKQKVNCLQCNIVFEKLPNQIKKSPNHFCSKSCAAKYNNTHKTKGNRRSKLEMWLEIQLNVSYPQLGIKYNLKEFTNTELDILIPTLNLAFELNGIFHYEPIYGQEKLSSIQNNDNRKFQACLEKKIELVIIDVSGQKYFKESTSQKYLEIVKQMIDMKLERMMGAAPTTSTLAKLHSTVELHPLK